MVRLEFHLVQKRRGHSGMFDPRPKDASMVADSRTATTPFSWLITAEIYLGANMGGTL